VEGVSAAWPGGFMGDSHALMSLLRAPAKKSLIGHLRGALQRTAVEE